MIDLARILDQFEPADGAGRETELGTFPNEQFGQDTEKIDISHISQFPTANQERYKGYRCALENPERQKTDGRVARDAYACAVGNVGTAGNVSENNDLSFPLTDIELGNWEREEGPPAGEPSGSLSTHAPDLNRAGPQRSDWWDGPLMAEIDAAALPIPPSKVRAGVAREMRALADLGATGPEAEPRAVAIVRAKIWNSPTMAERQIDNGRCHVCGSPITDDEPMVAILTAARDRHLFMHSRCHLEHLRRREALVDKIMAAAGFGSASQEGSPQ